MAAIEARRCKRNRAWHRAQWRGHVVAQAGSGVSAAEYCREHGVNLRTFYNWRRIFLLSGDVVASASARSLRVEKQSRDDKLGAVVEGAEGSSLFAELRVPALAMRSSSSGIEVVLAGERCLRLAAGFDEETLRRVVVALEGLSC